MLNNIRLENILVHVLLSCFIIFNSCSFFSKDNIQIIDNYFTGEKLYFSDLDKNYKKSKNFSKIWSKIHSKRFRSYHKFLDKKFMIIGESKILDKNFVIIKDKKNRLYKSIVKTDTSGNIILPSHLLLEKHYKNAKKLIDKEIWLNFTNNNKIFYSNSNHNISRFSKVKVTGLIKYQDGENYLPLWLKIKYRKNIDGLVRYCPTQDNVGFEDHYFTEEPLPRLWGDEMIDLILKGETIIGMAEDQLRKSIGNPDMINKTSSRYGMSEQWIYVEKDSKSKTFYQFEYGKLVYVNK